MERFEKNFFLLSFFVVSIRSIEWEPTAAPARAEEEEEATLATETEEAPSRTLH